MKQKLRSDLKLEDTWDLTVIFKNDEEVYKELKKLEKDIDEYDKYKGNILKDSNTLFNFLDFSDNLERKIYKVYYYSHLKFDQDTTNSIYQELSGKVSNLIEKLSLKSSYVTPEMMKGDMKLIEKYVKENKKLEVYRFNLESFYRHKEHSLNDDEEKILANLGKTLESIENTYEALTDGDITFPNIKVNSEEVELTESNYSIFIRDNNRDVRKDAFNKLLGTYGNFKNTLASTFNGNVSHLVSMAKIKKFNSSIEASLFNDNISTDIYNTLIDTINNNLNTLYDYYELRRKTLKLDELHLYDIYTSMVENYDKKYTFNEAKDTVIEALSVLGDEYISNLKKAFDERWIDIYNNKGKRGGAYSSGFYDTNPYVLLNFEGQYQDVSTLAHELGHSMHTYYSCKNQPYNLSSYKIFVAEVASTVNELLLVKYLINKSTDKNEKLFLLNQLMELYKSTIYRQVMFAEFERDMHRDYENGEVLTNEYLCKKYYELVSRYFGNNVVCDDAIKYEWSRIPHFYYNFYVYKYAIGLSCATKIVNNILSDESYKEKYLNFLKTGGSMYPKDELMVCDIDISSNELYQEAINQFKEYQEEFIKIKKM